MTINKCYFRCSHVLQRLFRQFNGTIIQIFCIIHCYLCDVIFFLNFNESVVLSLVKQDHYQKFVNVCNIDMNFLMFLNSYCYILNKLYINITTSIFWTLSTSVSFISIICFSTDAQFFNINLVLVLFALPFVVALFLIVIIPLMHHYHHRNST